MTNIDLQQLIGKYLEGETTPMEERQLARELQSPNIAKEWQAIRLMLGDLAMGETEYDDMMKYRRRRLLKTRCRWVAAAVCLLLIIGISVVWYQDYTYRHGTSFVELNEECRVNHQELAHVENSHVKASSIFKEQSSIHRPSMSRKHVTHRKRQATKETKKEPSSIGKHLSTSTDVSPSNHPQPTYRPMENDLYTISARQAQAIRQRGERLEREIEKIIENDEVK